jgi:type II secretory pathway component PulC
LLVNSLALQPVNRGGRAIGFEIMPQADAGALAPIGLLPGDILLSVGGLEANTANLAGQREKLLSGEPVEIRFERGGQIHTTSLGRAGQ